MAPINSHSGLQQQGNTEVKLDEGAMGSEIQDMTRHEVVEGARSPLSLPKMRAHLASQSWISECLTLALCWLYWVSKYLLR